MTSRRKRLLCIYTGTASDRGLYITQYNRTYKLYVECVYTVNYKHTLINLL